MNRLEKALEGLNLHKTTIKDIIDAHEEDLRILALDLKRHTITYSVQDVMERAKQTNMKINKGQAVDVLEDMIQHHDMNDGITWNVMDVYIEKHSDGEIPEWEQMQNAIREFMGCKPFEGTNADWCGNLIWRLGHNDDYNGLFLCEFAEDNLIYIVFRYHPHNYQTPPEPCIISEARTMEELDKLLFHLNPYKP